MSIRLALHSKAWIFAIYLKVDLVFSSRLDISTHLLWIIPWEGPSVVFQHKYPRYYSNINFVFRHRYPKFYSNIHFYWPRGGRLRRNAPRTKNRDTGVYPPENLYIPFWKLCILGHSTGLCFLVVKSFIAANDDQLWISWKYCKQVIFSSKVS